MEQLPISNSAPCFQLLSLPCSCYMQHSEVLPRTLQYPRCKTVG